MSGKVKLTVRLDPQEDADLVAWIEDVKRRGYGALSREIKAALRAIHQGQNPTRSSHPGLTEQDRNVLLGDIRQVVEAAIASALGEVTGTQAAPRSPHAEEDTTALLDALGEHLLLDEDEL